MTTPDPTGTCTPKDRSITIGVVLQHAPRINRPTGSSYDVSYTHTPVDVRFHPDEDTKVYARSTRGRRVKKDGSLSDTDNSLLYSPHITEADAALAIEVARQVLNKILKNLP